ncbi:hypothetical protein CXG81DRAFT_29636 [Caulochytrium protostelioides]|uniref:DUF431-domain-containing protein n=1 Tax=Caulochytrium protostelioides TaxID=1555241 RepID=A0A4P9X9E6_9FUNG|nr:hypothetical protein CXG81DRAFT_29636 [Caulochytrium protostelioides]|eukprot:RKP01928.1 hypothetical protein CXG81DRAFT_29636 [Caulochytrium protostelioides]
MATALSTAAAPTERRPFLYAIEHMEPEVSPWSLGEYHHIIEQIGEKRLILSHIAPAVVPEPLRSQCYEVADVPISEHPSFPKSRVLLLDPKATQPLEPSDGADFDVLLFGGILGDDPPRDRTAELRDQGFATRHLGPVQMTTDTAILVSDRVLSGQQRLDDIPYVDNPDIVFNAHESVNMPFRYIRNPDGTPLMSKTVHHLIHKSLEEEFDV